MMIESIILLLIGGFLSLIGFFGKSILDSKNESRRMEEQKRIEDARIEEQKRIEDRRIEDQRRIEERRVEEQRRIEEQRKFEEIAKRKEFLSSQITNSSLSKDLRILAYTEYKALGGNGFADQYVRENLQ